MRIALFQPDIPQNTGTILRTAACLGLSIDIIGPTGFDMTDRALRRSGLDYLDQIDLTRHVSWQTFLERRQHGRLVLFTTKSADSYLDTHFHPDDTLLFGRESSGVPQPVHDKADLRVTIPMRPEARSLNLACAVAMASGEALRQTKSQD